MIPVLQNFFRYFLHNNPFLMKIKTHERESGYLLDKTTRESGIHLWVIQQPKWSIICTKEVSNRFIVDLHCGELQNKCSFFMLKVSTFLILTTH